MNRKKLLYDLYVAYCDAKKHKNNKKYVKEFTKNLKHNLEKLSEEIFHRKYIALPSTCFIIEEPKKREVFAANFRDRIVHHLYFNYTHKIYERLFIADSYSCIKNRGTHYGVKRLEKHIRQESLNYSRKCYILKIDIQGYFMHIDRNILLKEANKIIEKYFKNSDYLNLLLYLNKEIILLNPIKNSIFLGKPSDYDGLPENKRLDKSPNNCGLPIGNLTSQLFSNVYMNKFDQWVKRELKAKHYGRYVDDAYIVSCDKEWLKKLIPLIQMFLKKELHLDLHLGKTRIYDNRNGVEFLGAYIKPYRTYVSNKTLERIRRNFKNKKYKDVYDKHNSLISYLGMLSHYKSYKIKKELIGL